jgi:hypothetical protein
MAGPAENEGFDAQMGQHHYLGAGRAVGDYLRQIVEGEGRPVALLVWGPACYALKDRDRWISWSAPQRGERLKLIVQNRRFLLLTEKGLSPNLASQALGGPRYGRCPGNGRSVLATARGWPRVSPTRKLTRAPVTKPQIGNRLE